MADLRGMTTEQAFQHATQDAGWDIFTQTEVLLEYITRQESHDAFCDFLERQVEDERAMADEEE